MMHEGLLSLYCKTYASMSYSDLFNHLRLSPAATYFMVNGAHYGSGLADNFIRAGKPAYMLLAEYAAAALFIIALGVFAFRRRKSERAGTALAFRPLRLPVKTFMCIVMGTAFAPRLPSYRRQVLAVAGTGVRHGAVPLHHRGHLCVRPPCARQASGADAHHPCGDGAAHGRHAEGRSRLRPLAPGREQGRVRRSDRLRATPRRS